MCQVGLLGFELILEQVYGEERARAGHGRLFIGLEKEQIDAVLRHIAANDIQTERRDWGQPTLVIRDLDDNELFFWDWPTEATRATETTIATPQP